MEKRIEIFGVFLEFSAEVSKVRFIENQEVFDDDFHKTRRGDKANIFGIDHHSRIESYHLALIIDAGPTRVARVDRSIGDKSLRSKF